MLNILNKDVVEDFLNVVSEFYNEYDKIYLKEATVFNSTHHFLVFVKYGQENGRKVIANKWSIPLVEFIIYDFPNKLETRTLNKNDALLASSIAARNLLNNGDLNSCLIKVTDNINISLEWV